MEINTLGVKPRENACPHAIIQNFINFDFTVSKPDVAKKLFLPEPLEPMYDEDGDVMLTCGFVDSAFPPLREVDGEIPDPNGTEFCECALGMGCLANGKANFMNSWILLDHYAGALRRGFNRSVIDTFQRTRNHPMLEGDEHIHIGSRMFATCCNDGALYARASLEVKEVREPDKFLDPHFFDWGQLRYLPDMAHGDDVRPLIQQASLYHFPAGMEKSKVYVGDGKLEFGDTLYNLFRDMGEIKVKRAFFITFAYTYGSEEFICDIPTKKN